MAAAPADAAREPIAVLGAGRLGLCFALCAEAAGHPVTSVDVFPSYVDAINAKTLRSHEPEVERMLRAATRLRATTSVREAVEGARMLFVFVQTPSSGGERHYDHSHVNDVLSQLNALRVRAKHVVICCTVMPGYCTAVAPALLRDCEGVDVSYSPAFIAQGEIVAGLLAPELVLIGAPTDAAALALESVQRAILGTAAAAAAQAAAVAKRGGGPPALRRMSPASAEIAKLALNCFVTLKIAFANWVADTADATDLANAATLPPAGAEGAPPEGAARVDKGQILEALGCDSRVGTRCIAPGYGFGGPCFPRDNRALGSHARAVGVETAVPEATDAANAAHARAQAGVILRELERAGGGASTPAALRVRDVAYKSRCPVPIVQESQKLAVAARVRESGVRVRVCDRQAVLDAVRRDWGSRFEYEVEAEGAAEPPPRPTSAGACAMLDADEILFPDLVRDQAGAARADGPAAKRARTRGGGANGAAETAAGANGPAPAPDAGRPLEGLAESQGEGRLTLPHSFTH